MSVKKLLEKIKRPTEDELCPAWWIKENILSYVDQALALLAKSQSRQSWSKN